MNPRQIARLITPPGIVLLARTLRRAIKPPIVEWQALKGGAEAFKTNGVRGWNDDSVRESYYKRILSLKKQLDEGVPVGLESIGSFGDQNAAVVHNSVMIFALALSRAAQGKDTVSLLDWGGGLGHYGLFAHHLRPDLDLDYAVKEMEVLIETGKEIWPNALFSSEAEVVLARQYDLVMAMCSLHYSCDWRSVFEDLSRSVSSYLLVSRMPIVVQADSFAFIQRPYAYGYHTEYVAWCLNREEFLETARQYGLILENEFICGECPPISDAPEACQYRGYLFSRQK